MKHVKRISHPSLIVLVGTCKLKSASFVPRPALNPNCTPISCSNFVEMREWMIFGTSLSAWLIKLISLWSSHFLALVFLGIGMNINIASSPLVSVQYHIILNSLVRVVIQNCPIHIIGSQWFPKSFNGLFNFFICYFWTIGVVYFGWCSWLYHRITLAYISSIPVLVPPWSKSDPHCPELCRYCVVYYCSVSL